MGHVVFFTGARGVRGISGSGSQRVSEGGASGRLYVPRLMTAGEP